MTRLEAALSELAEAIREEVRLEAARRPDGPERLLSIDQASDHLGLGRSKVYAEIAAARLRSILVGRRRLVPSSAIAAYINETAGAAIGTPASAPAARRARGEHSAV